jgi:hypothetical protein
MGHFFTETIFLHGRNQSSCYLRGFITALNITGTSMEMNFGVPYLEEAFLRQERVRPKMQGHDFSGMVRSIFIHSGKRKRMLFCSKSGPGFNCLAGFNGS